MLKPFTSLKNLLAGVVVLGAVLWAPMSAAILTIEITQGLGTGMPIAIVPFKVEGVQKLPEDVSAIIDADLSRSGRFTTIPRKDFLATPQSAEQVNFKDWRLVKAEAVVIGGVKQIAPGRFQVEFRLFDVFKETQLAGYQYVVGADMLRMAAHQIADVIYEKLTGEPGVFNTRIAYVTKESTNRALVYRLQVADSDGYNATSILSSPEPIMSPAWSPDGTRLAYVSFEQKRSMLYIQHVIHRSREKVAEFRGINSAPAWSPDGTRLALVSSRDGNPEIYVMRLSDKSLTRLTNHPAIDTEPAWSPDGRSLVFTSDRSGRPQIFRMSADGGSAQRVTFEGEYNARASFSPDGNFLTMISATGGRYHIGILQLKGASMQILTDTPLDESPTFAPNGRMILYATSVQGRGVLASVSSDGRVRQLLKLQEGDVREPAWSPFNRQLQLNQGARQ